MWFGRIVPLFRFPLTKGGSFSQQIEEERNLPLPSELCVGMNIDDGSSLYVTYGVNPNLYQTEREEGKETWGEDLAGWFVIAPFPPSLFSKKERWMRLGVHVKNEQESFRKGVTTPVSEAGAVFLAMEVLGCGDMGSLVLLPSGATGSEQSLKNSLRCNESVRAIADISWDGKRELRQNDWIESLFLKGVYEKVSWSRDRRVLIRDQQITIPYGDFWRSVEEHFRVWKNESGDKVSVATRRADYCLLARDMELPVLLALLPARPLFRVDVSVAMSGNDNASGEEIESQVGSGILNEIVGHLSDREINIWHIKNTHKSLAFDMEDESAGPVLRDLEGNVSIVASVPKEHSHDRPSVIAAYLRKLRESMLCLRRHPREVVARKTLSRLDQIPAIVAGIVADELKSAQLKSDGPDLRSAIIAKLSRILSPQLEDIKQTIQPSFVKAIEIHGPPLFRCFFSHSARPAYDERDHISRLKLLLESEVFEVIEGEFSLGMSTEALSRGRIRNCDLFVSFLWPRDDFHTDKGEYLPPEWVIHEESFAIGQNLPVFRVREESVMPPRYERDRIEFSFTKGNIDSWNNLEQKFRLEIRQVALQKLLGIYPAGSHRAREFEA